MEFTQDNLLDKVKEIYEKYPVKSELLEFLSYKKSTAFHTVTNNYIISVIIMLILITDVRQLTQAIQKFLNFYYKKQ